MSQEQKKEVFFLNENGVQVTNTRFVLPKQTFAMSGITSVQSGEDKPSQVGPIILITIGMICLFNDAVGFGLTITALGGLIIYTLKTKYHVLLQTASGEAKALSSTNGDWIKKVVHSLHESIVYRG